MLAAIKSNRKKKRKKKREEIKGKGKLKYENKYEGKQTTNSAGKGGRETISNLDLTQLKGT